MRTARRIDFRSAAAPLLRWCVLTSLLLAWLLQLSSAEMAVAAPMVAAVSIGTALVIYISARDGGIPLLDAGLLCVSATLLYMVFPLVGYLVNDLHFSGSADARLFSYQPDPYELGAFHWRHVLYVGVFCATYAFFRSPTAKQDAELDPLPTREIHAIVVVFLVLSVYFVVLERTTGFSYQVNYEEMERVYGTEKQASVPLPIAQVSHYLYAMLFVVKLLILTLVIRRARAPAWKAIWLLWAIYEVGSTVMLQGSRTPLVLFLLASVILYHRLVRRIPTALLLAAAAFLLWWFLIHGQTRMSSEYTAEGLVSSGNEFQSLLGTTWDVHQRKLQGTLSVPWQVYFNDVMRLLPPQQFVPFTKIEASQWYMSLTDPGLTFQRQSGKMWGVVSQCLVGLDWIELMVRGALLGYALARLHAWYRRRSASVFVTVFYVWVCVHAYNTYRDTTFALLNRIIFAVVPALVLVRLVGLALRDKRKPA